MKKKVIKKISILLSTLILGLATAAILINVNMNNNNTKFKTSTLNYSPTQAEIKSGTVSETNYVAFNNYYAIDLETGIVTAKGTIDSNNIFMIFNDIDLYAMSYLCNNDSLEYKNCKYELYSNIEYNTYSFQPIKNFYGEFNGNGFEIHNLKLVQIDSNNEKYKDIEYYSMFQYLNAGGRIENVGLVDSDLIINASITNIVAVAPLCGVNKGTITNCYVKDLRNPNTNDDAGIKTFGGFLVSGMVYDNQGTFTNSYAAYGILCSYYVTDYISFYEILGVNSGKCSDLYFYNSTLKSINNNKATYDTSLVGKIIDITGKVNYSKAIWCENTNVLCTKISENENMNNWYTNSKYQNAGKFKSAFDIDTPILRGLNYNEDKSGFDISNIIDFLYMFELFNSNSTFASVQAKYIINCDINLSNVDESKYKYDGKLDASIIGAEKTSSSSSNIDVTDAFNKTSNKYTIYNANFKNTNLIDGIYTYGFISELSGTISNLNFYYSTNIVDISGNSDAAITSIGGVVGILNGGTISNVNVYLKSLKVSSDIGHYYFGGIAGLAKNNSNIYDVTTAGEFNGNTSCSTFTSSDKNNLIGANSIGGIVGYIMPNGCSVNLALNAMNLVSSSYSSALSVSQNIGGIIGSGYTQEFFDRIGEKTSGLFNKGNIEVKNPNSKVYVAGVIGKHIGISNQVYHLYNQGRITLNDDTSSFSHYVSGVCNVELITVNGDLEQSSLKNNSRKVCYYATDLKNSGTFEITSNYNVKIAGVSYINTNSSNQFVSVLSKIYNLGYEYRINDTATKYITKKIDAQQIDISMIDNYTGCIQTPNNLFDDRDKYKTEIQTVYNFRDVELVNNSPTTKTGDLKYSGTLLGNCMKLTDARNEGNITYKLTNNVTATSIITTGVFEENSGYENDVIYNSGNITLNNNILINANIYFSGICHKNANGYSTIELNEFNPLSNNYDKTKTGAINNAINNGDILVTNEEEYKKLSYKLYPIFTSSYNTVIGNSYLLNSAPSNVIKGNINVTGGIYLNSSVVSNTYNLGDVSAYNYASDKQEINASGISILNTTNASYILNSANNGIIKAINLSGKTLVANAATSKNQPVTTYKVNVNAAGISVRNDKNNDNTDYSGGNGHANQVISFTINYGSVFAYSNCENITEVNQESSCKASGILAMGLCNVINTVNYGNIYGSEAVSGIFGIVYFSKFESEVSGTTINIANSINYGNIYQIDRGRNINSDKTSYLPSYTQLVDFDDKTVNSQKSIDVTYYVGYSDTGDNSGNISKCTTSTTTINPKFAKVALDYSSLGYKENWSGSIFSILNFNSSDAAKNINIRYLISFNENVPIISNQTGIPSSVVEAVNVNTIYSSYYELSGGKYTFSTYMSKEVQYAPLSSSNVTINGKTYMGLFNSKFPFRLAIEGTGLDDSIATDKLLNDYFQFVVYPKINTQLLEKIGWRTMAYDDAAKSFFTNLDNVYYFYEKYNDPDLGPTNNSYNTDKTNALNTASWSKNADTSTLVTLVEKLVENKEANDIQSILKYLFSDECSNSLVFNDSFRGEIVDYIANAEGLNLNSIFNKDLLNFEKGYSKALADVLCGTSDSGFKTDLIKQIKKVFVDDTTYSNRRNLVLAYADYLCTGDNNQFFNSISISAKYQLLLDVIDINKDIKEDFYSTLLSLFSSNNRALIEGDYTDEEKKLMEYAGYAKLNSNTESIQKLFDNILTYNSAEEISIFLNALSNDLKYYDTLYSNDIKYSSKDDIKNKLGDASSIASTELIDNRVYLWNKIKNTTTFTSYLKTLLGTGKIYDKATEHKNTFQSNTSGKHDSWGATTDLFTYSSTVTSKTVFYGPYKNSSGDLIDKTSSSSSYSKINSLYVSPRVTNGVAYARTNATYNSSGTETYDGFLTTKAEDYHIAHATNGKSGVDSTDNLYGGQAAQKCYQSVFITSEKETADNLKKNNQIYTYYTMIYSNNEFFSYDKFKASPDTSKQISIKDNVSSITVNGKTYSIGSGAYITLLNTNGTRIKLYNGASSETIIFSSKTDAFTFIETYGTIYYVAFITSNWHSTYRTGVYIYQGPGEGSNYLCPNSTDGAITSHYIDYSAEDLLKIDGIINDTDKTQSDDERNIINRIFNEYLLNSNNKDEFLQIVDKSLLELVAKGTNGKTYNMTFINQMIQTSIETTKKITVSNTSYTVTGFLKYDSSNSLSEYLLGLYNANSTENKNKILLKASSEESVFKELLQILFDLSKSKGADGSYDPSGGVGYGASTDIKELYDTLVANNMTYDNGYGIAKGNAFPFTIKNGDVTTKSSTAIKFINGNNNVDNALTITANKDNIGYYSGASLKVYDYSVKDDNKKIDYTDIYGVTNETRDTKVDVPDEIRSYLGSESSQYLFRITSNHTKITDAINNESSCIAIENGTVSDYTGNIIIPRNCVWVAPRKKGYFRLIVVSVENGSTGFAITALKRVDSTDFDSTKQYQYKFEAANIFTSNDMPTSVISHKDLPSGRSYYFALKITQEMIDSKIEFAITAADTNKNPYFAYIDIGAAGGDSDKETANKHYYIQNNLKNLEDSLNKIISFLTPLYNTGENQIIAVYQENTLIEDIIRKLARYSNEIIKNATGKMDDRDNRIKVLEKLISSNYLLFDSTITNQKDSLSDDFKKWLTAAYLSTDYKYNYEEGLQTGSTLNLTNSILYARLEEMQTKVISNGKDYEITFINDDGSIDSDKFDNFLDYIGFTIKDGYGIFALASSEGIKNGQFIPDNFNLESMDAYYEKTSGTNSYWILSDTKSTDWRGGGSTDTALAGSVSEAFYKDMKQLKLSIATTIFELDLKVDNTDYIIYSSSDLIDLTNHTITYYVPESFKDKTFEINYIEISANAKYSDFSLKNLKGSIKITAEDETVFDVYTINIIPIDMKIELSDIKCYDTSYKAKTEVPADGGIIESTLSFIGENSVFPEGMDLTKFITLVDEEGNIIDSSKYSFAFSPTVEKVVNGTNTSYQATIRININSSFPGGTNKLKVNIYGITPEEAFVKELNKDCEIINFNFDGELADWKPKSTSVYTWTSYIKFGSMLNYNDLLITYDNGNVIIPDYLLSLEWTPTASISNNVAKELKDNLFIYTITYTVTAETGDERTYIHYLEEKSPISKPSVYKNNAVVSKMDYNEPDGTLKLNCSRDDGDVTFVIRYNINDIELNGAQFEPSNSDDSNVILSASSNGLSVIISNEGECKDYESHLIYKNSGIWENNEEYEREYDFPCVTITKTAATDSLVHKITFLEENPVLSTTATVMNHTNAIQSGLSTELVSENEPEYKSMKDIEVSQREISVTTSGINYNKKSNLNTNFFAVGSISNATLADYAPTFTIEDHAEIYQYTTKIKFNNYGYGKQQETDTKILTTLATATIYLYVPFTSNNGDKIFLIESVNGKWGNVYDLSMNYLKVSYDLISNSFTYDNITYTKSQFAGKPVKENGSLNMDYIGTPLDNHFWYVSYVVLSEDYLLEAQNEETNNTNLKFYHLAIIDATNTIYFDFIVNACDSYMNLNISSIYLSLTDNIYKTENSNEVLDSTEYISGFLTPNYVKKSVTNDNFDNFKSKLYILSQGNYIKVNDNELFDSSVDYYEIVYSLANKFQVLPRGYFYFYIDLPNGYTATYKIKTTNKDNQNNNDAEKNGYLPPSSIVTQRITVEITIEEGKTGTDWGVNVSNSSVVLITEIKNKEE